jgi:hypothetical protein
MYCNKRTEIAIYICVRIIVSRKSWAWNITQRSNILAIRRALSLTAHPYLVQLQQQQQKSFINVYDWIL